MRISEGCVSLSVLMWWFAFHLVYLHFRDLLLEAGSWDFLVLELGRYPSLSSSTCDVWFQLTFAGEGERQGLTGDRHSSLVLALAVPWARAPLGCTTNAGSLSASMPGLLHRPGVRVRWALL